MVGAIYVRDSIEGNAPLEQDAGSTTIASIVRSLDMEFMSATN